MKLTVEQRQAVRKIAEFDYDGLEQYHWDRAVPQLLEYGLIKESPPSGELILTAAGKREHREIMRSGDGPEALKELFRF